MFDSKREKKRPSRGLNETKFNEIQSTDIMGKQAHAQDKQRKRNSCTRVCLLDQNDTIPKEGEATYHDPELGTRQPTQVAYHTVPSGCDIPVVFDNCDWLSPWGLQHFDIPIASFSINYTWCKNAAWISDIYHACAYDICQEMCVNPTGKLEKNI